MKYEYDEKELFCYYDEKTIYGKLMTPKNTTGELPVIICSHGYNANYESMAWFSRQFAEHGIASYCFDFCGGSVASKSSGSPVEMSIKTEQADLKAVIDQISSLQGIDRNQIYLLGASQGGFISALVAANDCKRIKNLFLMFPAFCIPDDWKGAKGQPVRETIDFMGMTIGQKFVDDLPDFDVYSYIRKYEKHVKIFHGDADGIVKLSYAQVAQKAYPDCELTIYPGEGHGFSRDYDKRLMEEICSYVQQNQ
ncbi:alpha/beta hydrolase family protein [Anaerosporobacter faecicola]|uniref:alpha/beta hydrolase family protein n=1 Tax=Anaerosporobacter faecicola TaxID=2718714 RepID=UPI00143C4720|nr:alpha/beta fold hydrolase [Anaerosporobacter faecicola]